MSSADRFARRVAAVPPLIWAAVMLLAVAGLGVAATSVAAVARLDASVVAQLQGTIAVRDLERYAFAVTDLGGSPLLLLAVVGVGALLFARRWRAAVAVALAVGLTKVTVAIVKEVIERPRPEAAFETYGTFSFPSGHAASAAALYMSFAVLFTRPHRRSIRLLAIGFGALVTVGIGLSRVLLGAHFPTDVMAGWLVGGLLSIFAWAVIVRLVGHPSRPQEPAADRVRDVVASRDPELPASLPDDMRI